MQKPCGYPKEIFRELNPKFICVSCRLVLKNPIQSYCGHRFCKDCIDYITCHENSRICPACAAEDTVSEYSCLAIEQTFPDNAIKREFNSMTAACAFEGCSWSGPFRDYEIHYATCEHRELECQCGTNYPMSRQRQHLENECTFRKVNCPNCNDSVLFKDLDEHHMCCPLRPGQCMLCNATFPSAESPEEALFRHFKDNVAGHLMIAAQRICRLESITGLTGTFCPRQETLISRISTIEHRMRLLSPGQLQGNLVSNSQSTRAASPRGETRETRVFVDPKIQIRPALEVYECVLTALNREVEKLTLKMDFMQRQRRQETEQLDALDQKVTSLKRALAMKDVEISELHLRISALEQTSDDSIADLLKRAAEKICRLELAIGMTGRPSSPGQESLISRISRLENQTRPMSRGQQQQYVRATASQAEARGIPANAYPTTQVLVQSKLGAIQETMAALRRSVEMLTREADTMERQRQGSEQLGALAGIIRSLKRAEALRNARIVDLNLRLTDLEQASYDGTLLWRIDDFERRRQDAILGRATTIYSPVFYTSKTGYKMCVRLFLNGDRDAVGTHLSVSFVIMRGQYDAVLKWPFRGRVTITLLDQRGEEHVVHSFVFNRSSRSLMRPTNQMNADVDSNFPEFMSFAQLYNNSAADYIRDDTVRLKIVVCLDDGYNSDDEQNSIENPPVDEI